MTQGQRKFNEAQGGEYPTVISSLDLESAESRVAMSQYISWIREIHLFSTNSTVQLGRDIVSYSDLGARPKVSSDPWTPLMAIEGGTGSHLQNHP
jgi:hypothetical protein